jgi:hypothetical protein
LPRGIFVKERLPVLRASLIQAWDHLKQEISMMARRLSQAIMAVGLTLAVAVPVRADERWVKLPAAPYTLNNKQDAIAFADALTG